MRADHLRDILIYPYEINSDIRFVLAEPNDGKEYDVEAVINYADGSTYVVLVEAAKREPQPAAPVGEPEDTIKEL